MRVGAPAKVNLTLEVTGVEDNGYHTLDTIFSWLALEDELTLSPSDSTSLEMVSEGVSTELVTTDGDNLVLKAHTALENALGRKLPTRFQLLKRIPAGGGLGGGSADASACLVGLNRLYELGLAQEDLLNIARPLGADVSFGLVGGMARGTRYGDMLNPLPFPEELRGLEVVLVLPGFPCPTPRVYGLWDQQPSRVARGASERFLGAQGLSERFECITNDLEEPAFRLHPKLRVYKNLMTECGLQGVCLSGSGSTLFGFLPQGGDLETLRQAFAMHDVDVVSTTLKEERRFEFVS